MDLDSYFDSLGFDALDLDAQELETEDKPKSFKDWDGQFRLPAGYPTLSNRLKRASLAPLDEVALEHATHEMRLLWRQLDQSLLLPTELLDDHPTGPGRRRSRWGLPRNRSLVAALLVSLLGGMVVLYTRHCGQPGVCLAANHLQWVVDQAIAQHEVSPSRSETVPVTTVPVTTASPPTSNAFRDAVNQAMRAAELTQTAKTAQEWNEVAYRWLEAIALMRRVPPTSPHYPIAVQKAGEYARNLTYAQRNVERANAPQSATLSP